MRMHKAMVKWGLLAALFLGASSGSVHVFRTVSTYSGACASLGGFPGALQQAGFLPKGDCHNSKIDKDHCQHHACTVNGKPGFCAAAPRPGGDKDKDKDDYICVCKVNKISH